MRTHVVMDGALAGAALRLLAWYEASGVLRALVYRMPFSTGQAVDVALLATLARIREGRA